MSCLGSCTFQQIMDLISSVKVNLFTFKKVSLVRNTWPTVSSLYHKLIKCICKTTLLKVHITQKELAYELDLKSANETEKKN